MITDPWFWAAAVPAVLMIGISKGGFGGGVGALGVPLMTMVISPVQAAAILLPILMVMDLIGLWHYRHSWSRRNIAILVPASAVGVAIGWVSFRWLDDDLIRVLLGAIAVSFAAWSAVGSRLLGARAPRPAGLASGGFWGTVAGFTSFVAHAGSPPVGIYLLPQRLERRLYVGTTVMFYAMVNWLKLLPYAMLGQLSAPNLTTAAVLLPLAPLGVWLGIRALNLFDDRLFYRIAYVLLFLAGLKLIWDGATG